MFIIIIIIFLGLIAGSFVNAFVWRFYINNEENTAESSRKLSVVTGRSECTHCGTLLAPKDLVPVVSWLLLKGKCRYCQKKIEDNPLAETLTAFLFGVSYYFWPFALDGWHDVTIFILWLVIIVLLVFLFVYDLRWMLLPDKIVAVFTVLALAFALAVAITYQGIGYLWWSILTGASISAFFYGLYVVSRGQWIGGGDVKLLVGLGFITGSIVNGLLMIFIASLIGTLLVLPGIMFGRFNLTQRIPFGPLLIMSAIVVFLLGQNIDVWLLIMQDVVLLIPKF